MGSKLLRRWVGFGSLGAAALIAAIVVLAYTDVPSAPAPHNAPVASVAYFHTRALLEPGQERTVALPCADGQTGTTAGGVNWLARTEEIRVNYEIWLMGGNVTEIEGIAAKSVSWTDSANRTGRDDHENETALEGSEPHLDHVERCVDFAPGQEETLEFTALVRLEDGSERNLTSTLVIARAESTMAQSWEQRQSASCPAAPCA